MIGNPYLIARKKLDAAEKDLRPFVLILQASDLRFGIEQIDYVNHSKGVHALITRFKRFRRRILSIGLVE